MRETRNACRNLVQEPEEKEPFDELRIDGILLKWILKKHEGMD
jgi:hypothetical protein